MIRWLRQRFCSRVVYIENLKRVTDDLVLGPCRKCGKVLTGTHGLALNCTFERRDRDAP